MLLAFHPSIYIEHDWDPLKTYTANIANGFVKSGKYKEYLLYEDGASIVAEIPGGGWISKSGPSEDFFVLGGVTETEDLHQRFRMALPELTFTPATMCFSTGEVPLHKDNIKNGQASLVYPLHPNSSVGVVYDPENNDDFYYTGKGMVPTIINITQQHRVFNDETRIWFSIHFHESIETVKEVFDMKRPIII